MDLDERATLNPPTPITDPAILALARDPSPEFARFLYESIGRDFWWLSRLHWSDTRWRDHFADPLHELWVASRHGGPVGFVEMLGCDLGEGGTEVRIEYLGLLRGYRGHGLGGHLVYDASARARCMHERLPHLKPVCRVRLTTRNLDAPWAKDNYESRGYVETGLSRAVRPRPWFAVRRAVAVSRRQLGRRPPAAPPTAAVPEPRRAADTFELRDRRG